MAKHGHCGGFPGSTNPLLILADVGMPGNEPANYGSRIEEHAEPRATPPQIHRRHGKNRGRRRLGPRK